MKQQRSIAPDDVLLVQHRPAWKEQAFLRFAKIPHRVENCAFPFAAGDSPSVLTPEDRTVQKKTRATLDSLDITSGDLPKIFDRRNVAASVHTMSYMMSHLCDLDVGLNQRQKGQVIAFSTLVESVLDTILLQSRWVGWIGPDWSRADECATATTRDMSAAMKSHRTFPVDRLVAWMEKMKATSTIKNRRLPCATLAKKKLYEGYHALETLLPPPTEEGGRGPYMFGRSTPCSLDAIVFGHVSSACGDKMTTWGHDIQTIFPLLWSHYDHVRNVYFSRSMKANESNNFYRLSERARIWNNKRRVEDKKKGEEEEKEEKEEKEEGTGENKTGAAHGDDGDDGDDGDGGDDMNTKHDGGANDMYLPKAKRSAGRVGKFSGRIPSKPRKSSTNRSVDKDDEKSMNKRTAAELKQDWQNKMFVGFCGVSVIGYLLFSGRIEFSDAPDEY